MVPFLPTTMPTTPGSTVRVAASDAGIAAAAEALDRFQADQGLDPGAMWPVHVALDEILSNIVRHGAGRLEERLVDLTFVLTAAGIEVTIVDDGPEFDPLRVPEPDLTSPLQIRQPGGLGIHFVRRLMDRVEYACRDGRNHLHIVHRIGGPRRAEGEKD